MNYIYDEEVMKWKIVFEQGELQHLPLASLPILDVILGEMDENGVATVTVATLSDRLQLSKSATEVRLSKLLKYRPALLVKGKHKTKKGKGWECNVYCLPHVEDVEVEPVEDVKPVESKFNAIAVWCVLFKQKYDMGYKVSPQESGIVNRMVKSGQFTNEDIVKTFEYYVENYERLNKSTQYPTPSLFFLVSYRWTEIMALAKKSNNYKTVEQCEAENKYAEYTDALADKLLDEL